MQIPITLDHISRGRPCSPEYCALALAIAQAIPNARLSDLPSIGRDDMLIYHNGQPITLQNSPELEDWITCFDDTGKAQPITLELDFTKQTATIASPEGNAQ